jgi:flagellar biosynthesis protein FlhG
MRSSTRVDQAEGLRRLLVRNHTQVVTVVAGKHGVGRTSSTINLAAAMARSGKEVLVLDENHAPHNLLDHLGLYAKFDLLDVVQKKCGPREAVVNANGFSVLSTARAMYSLALMSQIEQQCLQNTLSEVCGGVDVLLVDASMPASGKVAGQIGVSSSLASGISLLVVVDATTTGITDSYALIKRLALENARLHFEIVVNKVVDEKSAMTVFDNMARVARRNLAARLEYLGYIPHDDKLKRATQLGKSVIEAFPTAISAKSYLELSQKLLHLPMLLNEADGGVRTIIKNLMKQVPDLQGQHSKKVAYDVNY